MSLKAGRVGVNPADVDPVSGHISPDATDSYTKSQADTKFLSKSDASSTYETKSDAAALQPKRLAIPITMLDGSKLTVESALSSLAYTKGAFTDIIADATIAGTFGNELYKAGNVVEAFLGLGNVGTTTPGTVIAVIPEGYRPVAYTRCRDFAGSCIYNINTNGNVTIESGGSVNVRMTGMWLTQE